MPRWRGASGEGDRYRTRDEAGALRGVPRGASREAAAGRVDQRQLHGVPRGYRGARDGDEGEERDRVPPGEASGIPHDADSGYAAHQAESRGAYAGGSEDDPRDEAADEVRGLPCDGSDVADESATAGDVRTELQELPFARTGIRRVS